MQFSGSVPLCLSDLDWDLHWCDKEWIHDEFDHIHLQPHQRVNHFRNHYELTRKDLLVKNMKRAKRQLEKESRTDEAQSYNVYPTTYVLPMEYSMFVEEFKKHHNALWIMKPVGKSQGKGIFLFDKLSQINDWKTVPSFRQPEGQTQQTAEAYVVQKYVENPLLIGGKKFDLRLYALVTSYSPLTVYFYRSGFARFSHTHFSFDNENLTDIGMHLTNVAVQKQSEKYDEKSGGKWDVRRMKMYLMSKYGEDKVNQLTTAIENIIIKSLLSVQKSMINDKHCFELYGYDILIDSNLKPWLLEVNASPSLTANTKDDYDLKCGMLDDVLTIVDVEKYLTGNELQVGGFDLIYKGGPVSNHPQNAIFRSYLGSMNDRQQQLKKLAKLLAMRAQASPEAATTATTSSSAPGSSSGATSQRRVAARRAVREDSRDAASNAAQPAASKT
ncbi:unnamed protein product [Vitrella brassicaformis CCMP3155]|uniref:Tubulin--tyrosine ligase-like protein 9 n=1 Tax=Vitrella brassicaformis (strain CCMP3155) TaxID=1169540 RepID=A0A0G4G3X3_VITBC|nr:unnamed protein product [Vitrella brassicaformis CCMP3155]|eukprot:CEM22877.1 unnamed protein product [Vitrella brassicaformis CCMP3155]